MLNLSSTRKALIAAGLCLPSGKKTPNRRTSKENAALLKSLLDKHDIKEPNHGIACYLLWNGMKALPKCTCGSGKIVTWPTLKACSVKCARTKALDPEPWSPALSELKLPLEKMLTRYGLDLPSKGISTIQRQVLTWLKTRAGINGTYQPRLIVQLLREGKTAFDQCSCGSGIEVIPKHGNEEFCSAHCSAARASRGERMKSTNLERYGVHNIWSAPAIKQRLLANTIRRFQRLDEIKDEVSLSTGLVLLDEHWQGWKHEYRWSCPEGHVFNTRFGPQWLPICRICTPKTISRVQREIATFIEGLGIHITMNDRKVIAPYELDILVEDRKLAVEINGVYFHDDRAKQAGYHKLKADLAEKAGMRLLQVTDAEWIGRRALVEDRLRSVLGCLQHKLNARSCEVRALTHTQATQFCEQHHLHGAAQASIRYGLYHANELVSVMTLAKPRFRKDHDLELIRFVSKTGTSVRGAASKLLAYARREHVGSIISYCDRRYGDGNVYRHLGFTELDRTKPGYSWFHLNGSIISRIGAQKHRLAKLLPRFSNTLSERQNMHAHGYWCVEDAGNIVFSLSADTDC